MACNMASFTNYAPGARGVNLKIGTTVWIEPGETVEIADDDIHGNLPDLGKKPSDDEAGDQAASAKVLADLKAENDALKARVVDLEGQIETLTKPDPKPAK